MVIGAASFSTIFPFHLEHFYSVLFFLLPLSFLVFKYLGARFLAYCKYVWLFFLFLFLFLLFHFFLFLLFPLPLTCLPPTASRSTNRIPSHLAPFPAIQLYNYICRLLDLCHTCYTSSPVPLSSSLLFLVLFSFFAASYRIYIHTIAPPTVGKDKCQKKLLCRQRCTGFRIPWDTLRLCVVAVQF
ncbi:hypothetical protein DFH11DRAFT_1138198 [Phellopilus nigrolimitatus]|nr:hypothetical protein DFH11DRAFT_1138198 [Phellopilus nigrolimitatus]